MSPDQIKQIEAIQQRIIQGNNELLSLIPKLKPADQKVYADKVNSFINNQKVYSGTNKLARVATK